MSNFCDLTHIEVFAGKGGDGASHFRREKYIDRGGPDGGNGGHGGNIIFRANENLNTLVEFHAKKKFQAEDGGPGAKKLMHGSDGEDLVLIVPVGTLIKDTEANKVIADLSNHGDETIVAHGGRGGLGNAHFKSSTNRAPTLAEKGEPGEFLKLELELQLVAAVGIIGLPSAGKSTLISRISKCRPKIAEYHFTTLTPNLGVVYLKEFDTHSDFSFVVTDIPGLIEGAHQGKGLGHEFLRHISRNEIVLHLLDATHEDIISDFEIINNELAKYSKELADKTQIVAINKIDAVLEDELAKKVASFQKKYPHLELFQISGVTGEGVRELILHTGNLVKSIPPKKRNETILIEPKSQKGFKVEFKKQKKTPDGKLRKIWLVSGYRLEQLVKMTDFENPEGLQRVHHFIQKMGIKRQLQKLGAQPGDTLRIGEEEITFKQ